MAIGVGSLRSAAATRKLQSGWHPIDACELCQKTLKNDRRLVAIDYERYEFVTEAEAAERGDAVSLFPVGAACFRKIQRALAQLTKREATAALAPKTEQTDV
ncbi:unnamed protein product [Sphagnum tenellum]